MDWWAWLLLAVWPPVAVAGAVLIGQGIRDRDRHNH
jgi:hypothetical protein